MVYLKYSNAPVGQISIHSLVLVLRMSLKSQVIGSEMIVTKPLLIKHKCGLSVPSSQILTHNPHLIHFAFSKIRFVCVLIFFTAGELTSLPLGSLIDNSSARSLNLQSSDALQSQCMQLFASFPAGSSPEISLYLCRSAEHSFSHSWSSSDSSLPIREVYRFVFFLIAFFSGTIILKSEDRFSAAPSSDLSDLFCEMYNCRLRIETGKSIFFRLQAFSQ